MTPALGDRARVACGRVRACTDARGMDAARFPETKGGRLPPVPGPAERAKRSGETRRRKRGRLQYLGTNDTTDQGEAQSGGG